ncbi:binding-protein-dependent transport systems inner membrane component [Lachnoclostridium phytofermentans ISDg]|uniref:Binding-protein-dependent transport systems inner membrane component n=2 Tax=Lachnoclostridium phytofermentans TaxID=66219 RepID=A9KKJ0_LACP7|nr:binding-protein-dependent transport systems inner membrane component [Lachnoclostridium phytofermentans ISDg]
MRRMYIWISTILLSLLCMIMVLPLIKVVSESFSSKTFIEQNAVLFWPKGFNVEAYSKVFQNRNIFVALRNSIVVTLLGTTINLVMTATMAYPLSRTEFKFKKPILLMVTLTMIFTSPMIPSYLVIKGMGLDNSIWAVILPGMISGYNFFIMRSFFAGVPGELIDAARIDGSGEFGILFKIVLPMSKAVMATMILFYGVNHWNALQQPLIYLRSPKVQTLQIKLYQILMEDNTSMVDVGVLQIAPTTIKMATIVISTIPILIVYPFLQKHFAAGAMLGSVKE